MKTLRAFIAVEMPHHVADAIRKSQQALKRYGIHLRWVRPENVHLTLRFLGDIAADTVPGIQNAMTQAVSGCLPFQLQVKGIGVFPGIKRPQVVWLGVGGQVDLLDGLYQELSMRLSGLGIPPETRPFRGHLTIGRVKGRLDSERLGMTLSELAEVETKLFTVAGYCLFKSDLTPGGAMHTPLVQVRIGNKRQTIGV